MEEEFANDMEDDWMEEFDPYAFLDNRYEGKSEIVVENGEQKSFFTAGEDNWAGLMGHNLIDICLEAGFVYERVVQLLVADGFIPEQELFDDIRFIYRANCANRVVTCLDTKDHVELDPCQKMTFEALENCYVGPTMKDVIATTQFEDNSKLSDEEWAEYIRQREKAKEWQPVFPVDLKNPQSLTIVQIERGKKLYEKLGKFIDNQPEEDHCPPEICISQDWEISVDFGGWRKDTDLVRSALCLMCEDEETGKFYLDEDYVMQCIPYLEEELEDLSDEYLYREGEIVDKNRTKKEIRWDIEWDFSEIVRDFIAKKCPEDTLIAVNTNNLKVYPISSTQEISKKEVKIFKPEEFIIKALGKKPTFDDYKISLLIKELIK